MSQKESASIQRLSRREEISAGSDRSFGLVFAAVFAILAVYPLFKGGTLHLIHLGVAASFLFFALAAPRLLGPLNRLWFRFGMLLHKVVNPLVMAVIFFGVITPIAAIVRVRGKDPLHRRFDPQADSYWTPREPPGPEGASMRRQF